MGHRLSNSISSESGDDELPAHRQPLTQASLVNRRNASKDCCADAANGNLSKLYYDELPSYRYNADEYQKHKATSGICSCLSALRPLSCRSIFTAFMIVATVVAAFTHTRQVKRHFQNSIRKVYYNLDPLMLGRDDTRFPAPLCMYEPQQPTFNRRTLYQDDIDNAAAAAAATVENESNLEDGNAKAYETTAMNNSNNIQQSAPKVAVVTYLRDDNYLPLFQQLTCTLKASNPNIDLALMYVPGDLGDNVMNELKLHNTTLLPVPPVTEYTNYYEPRYARNWLKLRAWSLIQYDAVLLVDSDVAIVGDISPLFTLPTSFAAAPDQSRWLNRFKTRLEKFNGGVLLLRPCPAVEQHMLQILEAYPKLRFTFGTAEQDFLTWYFRYVSMTLPLEYNAQASQSLIGNVTVGGMRPRIIHYTEHTKPWKGPVPGVPGHQYLCPRTV